MNAERRALVSFLSAALAMRSTKTNAQQVGRLRIVGVLMGLANDDETRARGKAIEQGLAKNGWIIGQNLHIEYRFAGADPERMHSFSRELVALHPDVIVGHSTPVVAALIPSRSPSPCASTSPPPSAALEPPARRVPYDEACWCAGFRFRGAVNNFRGAFP